MRLFMRILVLVVLCTPAQGLFAQGCFNWDWRNPLPHGNTINAMLFDGELYWAACDGGIIMSSPDGEVWDIKMSGLSERLLGIAFSPTTLVVVGEAGVNFHSLDGGDTWLPGQDLGDTDLYEVAYGNNFFLLVGENDTRYRSLDGSIWLGGSTRSSPTMLDVIFDGSRFIGVGTTGLAAISDDGIHWADNTHIAGISHDLLDIEYLEGQYVVTGEEGTVIFSSNGVDWVDKSITTNRPLQDSFYYDGKFHVIGLYDYVSEDGGTTWSNLRSFQSIQNEVAYNGNLFLVGGPRGRMFSTVNGIIWNDFLEDQYTYTEYHGAAYGNGTYVIVMSVKALTSTDGVNWFLNHIDWGDIFFDVIYFNDMFIAVSWHGKIFTSPAGTEWTEQHSLPTEIPLRKLAHNGSVVVAVGEQGTILYSSDGISWSAASFDPGLVVTDHLNGVCNGRSGLLFTRFVTVGVNGRILYSMDGMTWSEAISSGLTTGTLNSVASRGTNYVACGDFGEIYNSDGGSTWVQHTTGTVSALYHVFDDGEVFRAVGEKGMMLTSSAGLMWRKHPVYISGDLRASVVNRSQQFMVGSNGTILQRIGVETILPYAEWPAPKNIENFVEIMNDFCSN